MTTYLTRLPVEIWCQILQNVIYRERTALSDRGEYLETQEHTLLQHRHYELNVFAIDCSSRYAALQLAGRGSYVVDLVVKNKWSNSRNSLDLEELLPTCRRCKTVDRHVCYELKDHLPIFHITIENEVSVCATPKLRLLGNQWNELLLCRLVWRLALSRPFNHEEADEESRKIILELRSPNAAHFSHLLKRYTPFAKPYNRCVIGTTDQMSDLWGYADAHRTSQWPMLQVKTKLQRSVRELNGLFRRSLDNNTSLPLSNRTLQRLITLINPIVSEADEDTVGDSQLEQMVFPGLYVLALSDFLLQINCDHWELMRTNCDSHGSVPSFLRADYEHCADDTNNAWLSVQWLECLIQLCLVLSRVAFATDEHRLMLDLRVYVTKIGSMVSHISGETLASRRELHSLMGCPCAKTAFSRHACCQRVRLAHGFYRAADCFLGVQYALTLKFGFPTTTLCRDMLQRIVSVLQECSESSEDSCRKHRASETTRSIFAGLG